MNFAESIEKRITQSSKSGIEAYEEICFLLLTNTNLSQKDIDDSPIPYVFSILDLLKKNFKAKVKASKKGRK